MAKKWVVVKGEIIRWRSQFRLMPLSWEKRLADRAVREGRPALPPGDSVRTQKENHEQSIVEAFMRLPFHRQGRRSGTKFGRHPKRLF